MQTSVSESLRTFVNDCVLDAAIHPICVTFYLLKNIVSVMRWPKYNFTAFHFITFLNPNSFYTMHNLHLSLANFVSILRHKNNFLFSLRQIHVSSIKKSCSSVKTIFLFVLPFSTFCWSRKLFFEFF